MPEIVGTFLRTELRDEGADGAVKAWDGSRCHFTQECLEFAVRHLDGIEVAGSSIPCSRIQRRRARATSARCRSAACSTFFERDVVSVEKTPERAAAGFDPS